jgi:cytochrome P450
MTTKAASQPLKLPRPPQVKSLPIMGPILQFTGDVLPFLWKSRVTYGDAFRLRMFHLEMTCLMGPDAIELLKPDSGLRTSSSMGVLESEMQSRLPRLFDGQHHQMFRKAHLQFMNRNLETKCREDILNCLIQHTERWQPGVELDMLHEAQTQTVDVLSNILNGEPFPFSKKELALVVHTLIWATFGHAPKLILKNPAYQSAIKRMRAHLLKLVAEIKSNPEIAARTLVGNYLDLPLPDELDSWEDGDLVAVPLGAYLAGYDTLASASSFLIYRLLSNPSALAKVRAEYAELSRESGGPVDPVNQKYLRAAFLETTRLNPPGSAVLRFADRDFEFKGYQIRKGDEVLVVIAGDHLNEEFFPNPNKFDPERFLGGPDSSELKRKVLPFSTGNHRCTGSMLGELMAVEMVSHWISRFDLELVGAEKVYPVARPYTQPENLRVRVRARRVLPVATAAPVSQPQKSPPQTCPAHSAATPAGI